MPLDPPPGRYRVVEKDRRLIVIETATGAPVARRPVPDARPGVAQTMFDGRATLTTRAFYDAKGPRTLTLDPGATALLGRLRLVGIAAALLYVIAAVALPWILLLIPLLASQPKLRAAARTAATRWLDRYAATGSSAG